MSRLASSSLRLASAVVAVVAAVVLAPSASAQSQTESGVKPRLELSDTVRHIPAPAPPAGVRNASPGTARTPVIAPDPVAARAPRPGPGTSPAFRTDFVRNQALIGVGLYAPAFATTVAHDGVAWAASYLLVAGGSFVAAAEISRETTITDPMQRLATGAPIRGAVAGSMLSTAFKGDARATAASMLFASVGGTAIGLWLGRAMDDGEAAATLFGSDVIGLTALAAGTAAGLDDSGSSAKTRALLTVVGMVAGAPLGQAYAALAPYNVSVGDLTAMTATAGVGMLAGLTVIADGTRSDQAVAAALAVGGVAGLFAGDRLLVRRYDHTPTEGRMVVAGGLAGGLMGAGVALLTGSSKGRFGTLSGVLTTVGAAGGVALSQRYLMPKADGALRLGGLKVNPLGMVAAASGIRGTHTLGSIAF